MAYLEVPTRNNLPAYSYTITLDGTLYTLRFTFNSRMAKWFVDLSDPLENLIVSQVPVVSTWFMFDRFIAQAIPPGTLTPFDSSGQNLDAGRFDLGDRVRMIYAEVNTL